MGDYNKSIEELLKDFEDLQITKIVKQVNMQSGNPTGIGSTGSNHPTPNPFYEDGETSNSFQSSRTPSLKNKKKPSSLTSKRQTINEEFKPKNPLLQEPISAWGYFLNLDCVIDIRKTLETWKSTMV